MAPVAMLHRTTPQTAVTLNAQGSPHLHIVDVQRSRIRPQVGRRSWKWAAKARGPACALGGGFLVLGQLLGLPHGVLGRAGGHATISGETVTEPTCPHLEW